MRAYTYDDVLEMYNRWCEDKTKENWGELWITCKRRMEPFVHTKNKKLPVPIKRYEVIEDIIEDSVYETMHYLYKAEEYEMELAEGKIIEEKDDKKKKYPKKPKTAKQLAAIFYFKNKYVFQKWLRDEEKYNRPIKLLNKQRICQ